MPRPFTKTHTLGANWSKPTSDQEAYGRATGRRQKIARERMIMTERRLILLQILNEEGYPFKYGSLTRSLERLNQAMGYNWSLQVVNKDLAEIKKGWRAGDPAELRFKKK